jgi:hypothetical protein
MFFLFLQKTLPAGFFYSGKREAAWSPVGGHDVRAKTEESNFYANFIK